MAENQGLAGALQRAATACSETAAALTSAGVAPERLATVVTPKSILFWTRPDTMRELGSVWRIGPLLLCDDAQLYAAGRATRAAERGRPGYQSVSREERRELAAAALRGGFAAGDSVNFDAVPLPLSAADAADTAALTELFADPALPVGYADGEIRVRWRAGAPLAGAAPLAQFLSERAALLQHPLPE